MLEKHGESNYVCLYDETAFDVVFEHAQEYIQNHSTQDYLDYDWQIVAYSNEEAWKEDGLYDSIVLRIKGNTIKQYDVVTEYLNAFHTRERDGVLLSTLESQITQICEKYCATPTWNTILEIDTLQMLSKLIVEILQEKVMYVKVHHFSYIHIKRNRLPSIPDSFYFLTAKEAVMIAME